LVPLINAFITSLLVKCAGEAIKISVIPAFAGPFNMYKVLVAAPFYSTTEHIDIIEKIKD
jgi:hypothetical protein